MRISIALGLSLLSLIAIEAAGRFFFLRTGTIPDLGQQQPQPDRLRLPPPPPEPATLSKGCRGPSLRPSPPDNITTSALVPSGAELRLWLDPRIGERELREFLRESDSSIGLIERRAERDGFVRIVDAVPPDKGTRLPSVSYALPIEVRRYLEHLAGSQRIHIVLRPQHDTPALTEITRSMQQHPAMVGLLSLGGTLSAKVSGAVEAAARSGRSSSCLRLVCTPAGGIAWELDSPTGSPTAPLSTPVSQGG